MRKTFFKKNQIWLIPVILIVAYKVWATFKNAGITAGAIGSNIQNSVTSQVIQAAQNNGHIPPARISILIQINERIYKAFYKNDWFGLTEDEAAAAAAFNDCRNVDEAIFVATLYKQSFQKSLYQDIRKFTGMLLGNQAASWNLFSSTYLNAIKNI